MVASYLVEAGADEYVARCIAAGRAAWPGVTLEASAFASHLARHEISPSETTPPHVADLYLACACAVGQVEAIAAFDRDLMPAARAAARRIDAAPDFVDDVVQSARERLLVAALGSEPRIVDYEGKGPLRAWVRIAAMRIAMNRLRERRRDVLIDDEAFFDVVNTQDVPHAHYAQACSEALRTAFAALNPRERNLLRLHHLHGLTVDELAPGLRVGRSTVGRWLQKARQHLLDETRAALRSRLSIGDDTADSILRSLEGQLDISVSRLLAE